MLVINMRPSKKFWGIRVFISGEQGNKGLKMGGQGNEGNFGEQGT